MIMNKYSLKFASKLAKIGDFNIVICGVGGQGLLTLLEIIAEAALKEGYDVRTSELHGLAQRGGSVEVHIRFGKKIFSPLVREAGADLIIVLETQEALKSFNYTSKQRTIFLVNNFFVPIPNTKIPAIETIMKDLKSFSRRAISLPATDICQKEFRTSVTVGIFLLAFAVWQNLIPLKPNSVIFAIKKIIPEKHLELNLKTFQLAK